MRLVLVCVFVFCFLVVSIPIVLIELVIGLFSKRIKDRSSLAIVNWAFHMICLIVGVKVDVLGRENIPENEAVLFIGNHRSYFDIILTYQLVKGPTGYVSKKALLKVPMLNVWMLYLHCLFLDRSDIKAGMQMILNAVEAVKSGISICIFPEGTRSKDDTPVGNLKGGSFKIAEKSRCKVVPITLNNTDAIWEKHMPWMKPAHVVIEYGKPIETAEMSREEIKALPKTVAAVITETYLKNKPLV